MLKTVGRSTDVGEFLSKKFIRTQFQVNADATNLHMELVFDSIDLF